MAERLITYLAITALCSLFTVLAALMGLPFSIVALLGAMTAVNGLGALIITQRRQL